MDKSSLSRRQAIQRVAALTALASAAEPMLQAQEGAGPPHQQGRFRSAQDVLPSGVEGVAQPVHLLSLVAMGTPIFDNLGLELIGREAEKRRRWEFLVTASAAPVPGGTGSALNPIATF
jgi:hypothetical protein